MSGYRFDVAGSGACLKRYTDPAFFKVEWARSELMKAQRAQRDKKARREKVLMPTYRCFSVVIQALCLHFFAEHCNYSSKCCIENLFSCFELLELFPSPLPILYLLVLQRSWSSIDVLASDHVNL